MAQPAWLNKYLTMKPETEKVFDDLDAYLDYCRFELCKFNPADLYRKDSVNYQAYLTSKRPRRPYQGNKPRWDNNGKRNGQSFSR
jgi:hypothetical protein